MQVTMNGAPIEFAGRLLRVTLDARDTQLLHGAATIKHGQLEVVLEDPEAADPQDGRVTLSVLLAAQGSR